MAEDRLFTLEELSKFDGKEGRPTYFAVAGVVYDASASKLWRQGVHVRLHAAGNDLTVALKAAPHPADRLERCPKVGVIVEQAPPPPEISQAVATPAWARFAYNLHAHPASVHFPIALCVIGALFEAISLLTGWAPCGALPACTIAAGVALSPVAIVSGFVDWRYQFSSRMTRIFKAKITFSFVLLGVAAISLFLRFAEVGPEIIHRLLAVSLAPIALLLGFLGGRITFPRV